MRGTQHYKRRRGRAKWGLSGCLPLECAFSSRGARMPLALLMSWSWTLNLLYTHDLRSLIVVGLKETSVWKRPNLWPVRSWKLGLRLHIPFGSHFHCWTVQAGKSFCLYLVWSALVQLLPIVPHPGKMRRTWLQLIDPFPIGTGGLLSCGVLTAHCNLVSAENRTKVCSAIFSISLIKMFSSISLCLRYYY